MELPETEPGLSSVDALTILHNELKTELERYVIDQRHETWRSRFRTSFVYPVNASSVFHLTSILLLLFCLAILFIAFIIEGNRHTYIWLAVEDLILFVLLIGTLYFLIWDENLKRIEHISKLKRVLKQIDNCIEEEPWNLRNYTEQNSPLSPCISLQWTARDGHIINLPYSFLVEGDIIYLRPGQVVLVECKAMKPEEDDGMNLLKPGEVFNPGKNSEPTDHDLARKPWKPRPYVVKETPVVQSLRLFLNEAFDRPVSMLNHERYDIYTVWIERRILVLIFFVTLLANVLRYMFLGDYLGHWGEVCLSLQIQAIIPLTALTYPLMWKFLNIYGTARLLSVYHKSKQLVTKQSSGFGSTSTLGDTRVVEISVRELWTEFLKVLIGESDALPRTCNLLHVLGNVTSFCCVDKKGVLSWPNPSAEKVFFLTSEATKGSKGTVIDDEDDQQTGTPETCLEGNQDKQGYCQHTSFQVLDLTQHARKHFTLNFDDPSWKNYITSLKPLGLNILLNTCNMATADHYTQFADHVTCASLKHEASVPVMNRSVITVEALSTVRRRCFCELAYQIGFSEGATNIFKSQQMLGMYRHVAPAENLHRDRLKSKSFIKYKMPMPHMFSVVARETNSGSLQLFSQGTADLLLDACSDFWDGTELRSLTDTERKKIYDFYHRTSMSSYCTAFSYRPLSRMIGSEYSDVYIEIPEDAYDLFPSLHSPTSARSWDSQSFQDQLRGNTSFDSLFMDSLTTDVEDIAGCFKEQCNQVFIGMITMQYQAKPEIVKLIEDLESACIRFVHFSKENELRSRVFSEKMGLEAGWNCHISLLSQAEEAGDSSPSQPDLSQYSGSNRASRYSSRYSTDSLLLQRSTKDIALSKVKLSQDSERGRRSSAPGAISLDTSQVKFEMSPASQHCGPSHEIQSSCRESSTEMNPGQLVIGDEGTDLGEPLLSKSGGMAEEMDGREEETDSMDIDGSDAFLSHEQSRVSVDSLPASSFVTENTDSVTGVQGLSNRAKLPKGIHNLRPHIENVDNVPLLVSLFTDCTPSTTREMLSILQEYGEVVCCLGSSNSIQNTGIFLQADCSISLEPMCTALCMKHPSAPEIEEHLGPMHLGTILNSLPCSLIFRKQDNAAIVDLISLARHLCQQLRNLFLFFLMCQMTVSLMHTICCICLLPPVLSPQLTLWLAVVVIPLLSLTFMGNPLDTQVARMAQGKNLSRLPRRAVGEFIKYYLLRYLPSILVCLVCHAITLNSFCTQVVGELRTEDGFNRSCHLLYGDVNYANSSQWNGWNESYHSGLVISQNIVAFQLVLYFICGSLCFIHRLKQLWQKAFYINKLWCAVMPVLIVFQVLYFALDVTIANDDSDYVFTLYDVPIATWVVSLSWIFLLVPLHELAKRREIKNWKRYQKRARLDFGTKLGMNSPF